MNSNLLRLLNFDDLYLLRYLLNGYTLTAAAKELNLTQPAITQRLRKIESVFEFPLLIKTGRNLVLTREGEAICTKASDALTLMDDVSPGKTKIVINIGTRPEAGRSWLWPCIRNSRKKHPHLTFHLHFGSGQEIMSQLGTGRLDVILTSAPIKSKSFDAITVANETYVFVASPDIAKSIAHHHDLENFTLIEHDRSYPLTRYLSAKDKSKMRYRDVWFIESTSLMADAIAHGLGVGVVPEYLVRQHIKAGKIALLKFKPKLEQDTFRLVYRTDRDLKDALTILSKELINSGLR